jgi:hypothetical protein
MTEVPKPVASLAEDRAQRSVTAVMRTLPTFMGKASAKVSSISTPFIFMIKPPSFLKRYTFKSYKLFSRAILSRVVNAKLELIP